MAKVLVADDEPEVRKAIVAMVAEGGYETAEAYDGLSALDAAITFRPDVILLDWMLPELFGGEVLAKLRKDKQYAALKDTVVIVVSDFDDDRSVQEYKAAGADGHVAKRDDPAEMKKALLSTISSLAP